MSIKPVTYIIVVIICTMLSCMDSRSEYVLDSKDMEDLLYDIHKSHFIQEYNDVERRNGAMQYALMQNVLKQHGVTRAEYDSSIVYYTRNADELSKIYESLTERLSYEASVMGAGVTEVADTSDVWSADRHILLASDELRSTYQWTLDTDTLLQPGEKVTLKYLSVFLNKEAQRRATSVLIMRLKNDSVIVRHHVASQSGDHSVSLTDVNAEGIKSLTGMFVLHHPLQMNASSKNNNLKNRQILSITDLKLLHEPSAKPKEAIPMADSVKAAVSDSASNKVSDTLHVIGEKTIATPTKKTILSRPDKMAVK